MDQDLRVPFIMSEDSIDLIRLMLNRDVDKRIGIEQVVEHPLCKGETGPGGNDHVSHAEGTDTGAVPVTPARAVLATGLEAT